MTRSNRSFRRVCVLLIAMLAVALAQSPTDEQYGNGVVGVAAGGSDGGSSGISSLPFTGLDVAAIAAIGAGLVGAGLLVRKAAHTREDTL
jgi:hypothetical protein